MGTGEGNEYGNKERYTYERYVEAVAGEEVVFLERRKWLR